MEQYLVTLDSEYESAFLVHILAGHVIKFIRGNSPCMYYFDSGNIHMSNLKLKFSFLNTVSENKNMFKNWGVRKATNTVILNRKKNSIAKDRFLRIVKDN